MASQIITGSERRFLAEAGAVCAESKACIHAYPFVAAWRVVILVSATLDDNDVIQLRSECAAAVAHRLGTRGTFEFIVRRCELMTSDNGILIIALPTEGPPLPLDRSEDAEDSKYELEFSLVAPPLADEHVGRAGSSRRRLASWL